MVAKNGDLNTMKPARLQQRCPHGRGIGDAIDCELKRFTAAFHLCAHWLTARPHNTCFEEGPKMPHESLDWPGRGIA